jgi:DNA-binding response OmpR family regulator
MTHGHDIDRPLVLVAEDDEDILSLIVHRLERSGYEVAQARNGEDALHLLERRRPDLAVLDVTMPRVDGFEVTRQMRANDATRDVPVIILTARVQEGDVARGFAAGADEYVKKPFSPTELQGLVESLLGRR